MNPSLRALTLIVGLLLTAPLWASSEVRDIPTRSGVTQRLLLLKPERPLAVLVIFAGGERPLGIADDGSLAWGGASLLIRISPLFMHSGFAIAIVDLSSDQQTAPDSHFRASAQHAQDTAAIIAFLRKDSQLPVWLIGTASGTTSVLNAATRLQKNGADGIVLTSGISTELDRSLTSQLGKIRIPTLAMRKADPCHPAPQPDPGGLIAALKNSPKAEELTVSAVLATGADPCQTPPSHGYLGLEDQLVNKISSWIKAFLPSASFI